MLSSVAAESVVRTIPEYSQLTKLPTSAIKQNIICGQPDQHLINLLFLVMKVTSKSPYYLTASHKKSIRLVNNDQ